MSATKPRWTWDNATAFDASGQLMGRRFDVVVDNRVVPGILWHAHGSAQARPLVLTQHGGSGHKSDLAIQTYVRPLVVQHGFVMASIDGPIHGDRANGASAVRDGVQMRERFLAQWQRDPMIDEMLADWRATLEGLLDLSIVDRDRVGWLGTSMGTAYGLPFIASCDEWIKASVLGKWSASHINSERLVEAAPHVRGAVLFIQRWDDELFSREGTLALFDRLGTPDKRLHVYPGSHFDRSDEQVRDSIEHLRRYLGDALPTVQGSIDCR
jgi:dienelactone hydrolase